MKKLWIFILVLAVIAVVMKLTVPSVEKHYDVATEQLSEFVEDKFMESDDYDEIIDDYGIDKQAAMEFLKQGDMYKTMIRYSVENMLVMKDYVVCNVGKITYDGEVYPLTLGIFGHVFVMTDYIDEIQDASEKLEELKEKYNK